ncbi:MAG TPA: DUF2070 family protein [Candidatus Bathyarchaeota archaeon]|nr:DUF2070 family protein [Candidatus Bathyarchaeota archaeon]
MRQGRGLEEELHRKMDRLVDVYSEVLFRLPSMARLFSYLILASVLAGALRGTPLAMATNSISPILVSLLSCTAAVLLAWAIDASLLAGDPVLDARRCLAVEIFSLATSIPILIANALLRALAKLSLHAILNLLSVGAAIALSVRAFIFASASLASRARCVLCTLSQPIAWLASTQLDYSLYGYSRWPDCLVFALMALAVSSVATTAFLLAVRSIGMKMFGTSSFRLIRAFTASWVVDHNKPLEEFLDQVGTEADIRASLLLFEEANSGRPLGALAMVGVHPGPFRHVGSSSLPSLIKEALEAHLGCPVAVPHGLSGHELNLTSRRECEKLISALISAVEKLSTPHGECTPMIRREGDRASASCQLLGPVAFITLTAAPDTMEDLPQELEEVVVKRAIELGLSGALVVDAHNSTNGPPDRRDLMERFGSVALRALEDATRSPKSGFKVGMASVLPTEFSIEDGMGPGGITSLAIEASGQKVSYVVFDGNNMMTGLRERLLSELEEVGFQAGEVMTTDTHVVSARVLSERGYHPVGEVMDWDVLADYVRGVALSALRAMRPATVRWAVVKAEGLKVFGAEQLDRLCDIPIELMRGAKKSSLLTLTPAYALLVALALIL